MSRLDLRICLDLRLWRKQTAVGQQEHFSPQQQTTRGLKVPVTFGGKAPSVRPHHPRHEGSDAACPLT